MRLNSMGFSERDRRESISEVRIFSDNEVIHLDTNSTSKGNQEKWITGDRQTFIKEPFHYQNQDWKDYLVELVASTYSKSCKLPQSVSVVEQFVGELHGKPCSYSHRFLKPGESFISFSKYLRIHPETSRGAAGIRSNSGLCQWIIDTFSEATEQDCTSFIATMLLLDLIILNEDRHINNFGFIWDGEHLRPAPLFDFGLGLFEHDEKYRGMPVKVAMRKAAMKPVLLKVSKRLQYLQSNHLNIFDCLPSQITLSDFVFPSLLGKEYFIAINRGLGVNVH